MNQKDLEMLRMAKMCTFPGDFKNDLIKLNVNDELADDMAFAFKQIRKRDGDYNFMDLLMEYCVGDEKWTEAILKYINSYAK